MAGFASALKLIVCVAGIFGSFSYFALKQEDLFKKTYADQKFKATFFMMVAERALNAFVAGFFLLVFGGSGCKIPISWISVSGGTQMFAMALSNEALKYVSYPTQVLGKSCKMVPVFLIGIFFHKKSPPFVEFLTVGVVTIGVVIFNMAAPVKPGKGGGSDSSYGLALIVASLVLDGLTGGIQDAVKAAVTSMNPPPKDENGKDGKPPKMSSFESMFYTNAAGAVVALAFCLASGQMQDGIDLCQKSPEFLMALTVFGLSSAVGQCFVYYTVVEFSPLILSTITTTRKIFSTVYSVFRDPDNTLNETQWMGCGLVFVGIIAEILVKQFGGHGKKDEKKDEKKVK